MNDYEKYLPKQDSWLKKRENGLILSDYQISILKLNGIIYSKYGSLKEILFEINDILDEEEIEELENVAKEISDNDYYNEVNK